MGVVTEFKTSVDEIVSDLVTMARGLLVTSRYLRQSDEIVTVQYGRPQYEGEVEHKVDISPNYRGRLYNVIDRCIACDKCAKVCPTQCIEVICEKGADKKPILTGYTIDMTICLFCGLCTEACPDSTRGKGADGKPDMSVAKCLTMDAGKDEKGLKWETTYDYSSDRKEDIGYYWWITEKELEEKRAAAQTKADATAAKKAAQAKVKAEAAAKKAAEAPAVDTAASDDKKETKEPKEQKEKDA
ncbi:MAG: 4Fe-4S binding protein [Candidatus Lindowbacteria bacterium]|nr:4Fe-4S binding protein [Candidatus Lindowbacteria bacterium]